MVLPTVDWAFLYQLTVMPTGQYDGVNSLFDIRFLDDCRLCQVNKKKTSQDTILVELLTNSQENEQPCPLHAQSFLTG